MAEADFTTLSDRETAILSAIIHDFIEEKKPVGSRHLTKKYSFDLSSATIRNVMADLEKHGFIMQPHSSAGREPTDKGYRFYFDEVLNIYDSATQEREKLEDIYYNRQMELDSILEYSSKLLAGMSSLTGIALGPKSDQLVIKKVELVYLGDGEILAIFITRSKLILNRKIHFGESITSEEIKIISHFLNDAIVGYGVHTIKDRIQTKMNGLHEDLKGLKAKALKLIEKTSEYEDNGSDKSFESNIYIDGMENLCEDPDFFDHEKLRNILHLIGEKNQLKSILSRNIPQGGVQALIGHESQCEEIAGCSIITSTYRLANRNIGILGVIGPTRMKYDKLVPLVDKVSKMVSSLLDKMSR